MVAMAAILNLVSVGQITLNDKAEFFCGLGFTWGRFPSKTSTTHDGCQVDILDFALSTISAHA
jgi:hypothetical protein